MIEPSVAYRWARDLMAIVGVLGCLLVAFVIALFWYHDSGRAYAPAATSKPRAPTLEEASWVVYGAGLNGQREQIHLVDSGQTQPDEDGGGSVQAWCVRFDTWPTLDARWMRAGSLEPLLARTLGSTLDAAHDAANCVPDFDTAARAQMRVRMMRVEFNDGRATSSSVAMADPGTGLVYLVNGALLPHSCPDPNVPCSG